MNDRLGELRVAAGGSGAAAGADLEMGAVPAGGSAFMQAFFDDVQSIKKTMTTIRQNIRQIEQNHGECLTSISAEQSRESTERLEQARAVFRPGASCNCSAHKIHCSN